MCIKSKVFKTITAILPAYCNKIYNPFYLKHVRAFPFYEMTSVPKPGGSPAKVSMQPASSKTKTSPILLKSHEIKTKSLDPNSNLEPHAHN